jgi:glycosyltransferase involved in cell wall biosynthesis
MADPREDLISIVVPVFNEEANIRPFHEALVAAIDAVEADFEIIFVDDGSSDETFSLIRELSERDRRVKALHFSRNFGSHPALTAGLRYAAGAAVVMISVDLQDPPGLIRTLIDRWREGFHVVWGVRETRDDPWAKKTFASLFYALIRRIALPDYPRQGMDFGLLDRKVVEAFNSFQEANRIVPTLLVWAGFRQTQIPYHRSARRAGKTKWSFGKRIKAAIDIIVSFSYLPIRFMSYLGLMISVLSFAYALYLVVRKIFFDLGGPGWASTMVAVLFLGGLQLTMLGVLGEYIWRTTEQVRGRPLYIILDQVGFDREERPHETLAPGVHRVPGGRPATRVG